MTAINISNLHVDNYSPDSTRVAIGWNKDGHRFHIWVDRETWTIEAYTSRRPSLYKNAMVEHGQPGYFDTVKMNALSGPNRPIVDYAIERAKNGGLLNEAIRSYQSQQDAEHQNQLSAAAAERVRDAAPEIVQAADDFLKVTGHVTGVEQQRKALIDAIDKAIGGQS